LKKIDATAQLTVLTDVMRQILSSDPGIKEIVWSEPPVRKESFPMESNLPWEKS
jgi:hypothetical protein